MRKGFTLVEVLVAMAILVVVLALGVRYFASTGELARNTQARNELQDRVRMVMQLVTADLQMAGARYWNSGSQNRAFSLPLPPTFGKRWGRPGHPSPLLRHAPPGPGLCLPPGGLRV